MIKLSLAIVLYVFSFFVAGVESSFGENLLESASVGTISIIISTLVGLAISLPLIKKESKSKDSSFYKVLYGVILNLAVIGMSLIIWILGDNVLSDFWKRGLMLPIIIVDLVTVIIIGVVFSLNSSETKIDEDILVGDKIHKAKYKIHIFFSLVILVLLSFILRDVISTYTAVLLKNDNFCLSNSCVSIVVTEKATTNKDITMCLKSEIPAWCVKEIAWSTGDGKFCEYLEGGSSFKEDFRNEYVSRESCMTLEGANNPIKNKEILDIYFPRIFTVEKKDKNEIIAYHSVPYEYKDFCDLSGKTTNKEFVDYSNKIKVVDGDYLSVLKSEYSSVIDNLVDMNGNTTVLPNGLYKMERKQIIPVYYMYLRYKRGCGKNVYLIPFNDKTIVVENDLTPPFPPQYMTTDRFDDNTVNEFKKIPNVILPKRADEIFNRDILEQIELNILSNEK